MNALPLALALGALFTFLVLVVVYREERHHERTAAHQSNQHRGYGHP